MDPARVCQQESRSVSIPHAGPGPQTAPDACTFADDAPRPVPTASATSSTQWSRPIRIDVCSMFARMPRYGPAPPGIRSEARMPATGQNDSSRHVLAWLDSSSRRINEQRIGFLIRRFGVQVPGGAPGLTWGFMTPGCFCVSVLSPVVAPWLLARTDAAIRVLSIMARTAPDAGRFAREPGRLKGCAARSH